MLKYLSQLNHEEAKMNLELQFKNQKKREAESRRKKRSSAAKFSQVVNFRNTANFPFPAPLFMLF